MSARTRRNYYEILEIREDARPEIIRGAIRAWRAIHHPDKNPEQRDQANELCKQLAEIESVLCDPDKRAAYDRELQTQRRRTRPQRVRRIPDGLFAWPPLVTTPFDTAFNAGRAAMNLRHFHESARHFETCVRLDPDSAPAYYNLARSYQELGRWTDALPAYETTLRLSPGFADASERAATSRRCCRI